MSRHDDTVSLRQMLDHVQEAIDLAHGRAKTDFNSDRVFFLAVLKLVEIVGEAATRVSEATQAAHPEIPWRQIIGTRHHLIHGYDAVDNDLLWDIVTADFPPLADKIRNLLPAEKA
ncbi:MAG: DUF86 domain-containing protein [Kiritimatiellia bacterium]|nr:DUF86 domain-containing protein [Kiritimatiellia bacterium]